jgi:signal peptidase II
MIYGDINIITGANAGRKFEFFFSRVVDFINIGFGKPTGKWRWPYFNVADSCITIGLVILVFLILFNKDKKYGEKLPNNDENTETKEEAIQE